jgi:biopolymer transport protein ExbD
MPRLLAVALLLALPLHAADVPKPLSVTVEDGEVVLDGANLNLDELGARLKASGRQAERIYCHAGPNAKTVYLNQVFAAIHAAGFADIVLVGPNGAEIQIDPPV